MLSKCNNNLYSITLIGFTSIDHLYSLIHHPYRDLLYYILLVIACPLGSYTGYTLKDICSGLLTCRSVVVYKTHKCIHLPNIHPGDIREIDPKNLWTTIIHGILISQQNCTQRGGTGIGINKSYL